MTVARSIKDNPKILEFIDRTSAIYLDGCVNQPVAGFTEIANLVEIAMQPDIASKLEKAKALLAIAFIKTEVSKLMSAGSHVEVELGNAILREVQKNLITDGSIQAPWPGIPDGIAYEGTIESYLKDKKNIERISRVVYEEVLKKPLEYVANSICEGRLQDFWAMLTVPEQARKDMRGKLDDAEARYLELDSNPEPTKEELKTKNTVGAKLAEFNEEYKAAILQESRQVTFAAIDSAARSSEAEGSPSGSPSSERRQPKCR
jgi:hypothetical protein